MASRYRKYKAVYPFEARSPSELSMSEGDVLIVEQGPDGMWPSPEKWMQGYNENTNQQGEFPGGQYVEFLEEFVVEPDPPSPSPPPPEAVCQQAPPLPPQPSPRHSVQGVIGKLNVSQIAQGLGATLGRGDIGGGGGDAMERTTAAVVTADDDEEAPPPPPRRPKAPVENHVEIPRKGSRPVPPRPAPRERRRVSGDYEREPNSEPNTPTHRPGGGVDPHSWVSVVFRIPVACAGCK